MTEGSRLLYSQLDTRFALLRHPKLAITDRLLPRRLQRFDLLPHVARLHLQPVQHSGSDPLPLAHDRQQHMLCSNTIMMVSICFLFRQRQYFAGSLSESSKRVIWPWRYAHDDPLALYEALDTRRGKAVFTSNAISDQFASRDQAPDRHRVDPQQFCDLFCRQQTFHKYLLNNLNKKDRIENSIDYFEVICN